MPSCFIIMPISTPKEYHGVYNNDSIHFRHVLDCLIVPAIKEAGMEPIPPISEGSEVIHAEIIKNLENADLVLCDMSILNANVFFELGIRTALNKPVAMIKDDTLTKIPFDNFMINCHTYKSKLEHWEMDKEIEELTNHLQKCQKNNDGKNALWKHLSMKSIAESTEVSGDIRDYLQILLNKIDRISEDKNVNARNWEAAERWHKLKREFEYSDIIKSVHDEAYALGIIAIESVEVGDETITITLSQGVHKDSEQLYKLHKLIYSRYGYRVSFIEE